MYRFFLTNNQDCLFLSFFLLFGQSFAEMSIIFDMAAKAEQRNIDRCMEEILSGCFAMPITLVYLFSCSDSNVPFSVSRRFLQKLASIYSKAAIFKGEKHCKSM